MPTVDKLSALLELPKAERAEIAMALLDSLGEQDWDEVSLGKLAEERAAELDNGTVKPLSAEEFFAGLLG